MLLSPPPLPFSKLTDFPKQRCPLLTLSCEDWKFGEAALREQEATALNVVNYKCSGENFNLVSQGNVYFLFTECV